MITTTTIILIIIFMILGCIFVAKKNVIRMGWRFIKKFKWAAKRNYRRKRTSSNL
jgi:hypothetical protein